MRLRARTDNVAAEIDHALVTVGAEIIRLDNIGDGCPDRLVGFRGRNYLLEYKTGKGTLTPDQKALFRAWPGIIIVVRTAEEAVWAIGAATSGKIPRLEIYSWARKVYSAPEGNGSAR